MTESEWLKSDDLPRMWRLAKDCLSLRRVFLVTVARARACRKFTPVGANLSALNFLEASADDLTRINSRADFQQLVADGAFGRLLEGLDKQPAVPQAAVIRDVVGSPFRRVTVDADWLTSAVVGLATTIYHDSAFDRLPILADALQDAGCEDADILHHCRGGGPHVRGCWVVDRVLGHD